MGGRGKGVYRDNQCDNPGQRSEYPSSFQEMRRCSFVRSSTDPLLSVANLASTVHHFVRLSHDCQSYVPILQGLHKQNLCTGKVIHVGLEYAAREEPRLLHVHGIFKATYTRYPIRTCFIRPGPLLASSSNVTVP